MNLSVIPAAFNCLRAGEAVANPAAWKTGGEALKAVLAAFILSVQPVVKGLFGYDMHITPEVSGAVAAAVVWGVGLFFTAATSTTVGILPARKDDGPIRDASASEQGPLAAPAGGEQTNAGVANQVRPSGDPSNPSSGYLPG